MTMTKKKTKIEKKYDENDSLVQDTRGMSTVEYLILLVVIGVASIGLWTSMGKKVKTMATESNEALTTVPSVTQ
jgi:Flp pilus assembly pilin Flp